MAFSQVIYFCIFISIIFFNCVKVRAQLTSASASEGACNSDVSSRGARSINYLFFAGSRNYYVPIASDACYRGYAEVLLGRPANSEDEIYSMKLRIKSIFPFPPTFVTTGFLDSVPKKIVQVCPPSGLNQIICLPVKHKGSNGTDTSGISTSVDTIYYTDNKSTILIIRCLNSVVKDYKVLTTGPTVDESTRKILIDKIQEMGFDPSLMRSQTY